MSLDIKWTEPPVDTPTPTVNEGGPLKEMIISYVGEKINPENDEVTVPMIIDVIADEFRACYFIGGRKLVKRL